MLTTVTQFGNLSHNSLKTVLTYQSIVFMPKMQYTVLIQRTEKVDFCLFYSWYEQLEAFHYS